MRRLSLSVAVVFARLVWHVSGTGGGKCERVTVRSRHARVPDTADSGAGPTESAETRERIGAGPRPRSGTSTAGRDSTMAI